ncbi:MAG: response regulator [Candidatus Marinimicrobia bacterium]|nr:response regulator [Candidatus Neomarinimicrobiota bacterium]
MAKVLLIDDEYSIRFTIAEMLRADGYDVITAQNAEEAWQLLQKNEFDIVVSDVLLPGTNGLDLVKRIRASYPLTQIVVISGEPDLTLSTQALKIGVFDYLLKPVSGRVIRKVIAKAYNTRILEQQKHQLKLEVQRYNDQMECLVKQRTAKLIQLGNDLKREIDRHKQTREQLKISRELLTVIGNQFPDMIAFIDKNRTLCYANNSFSKWFLQDGDYSGKKLRDVLGKENFVIIENQLNKAMAGNDITYKHSLFSKEKNKKIFRIRFRHNDHLDGVFIICSNITDQP